MFNLTATFNKAVNFTHSDSEGSSMTLFGLDFTVSSSTDADTLVLLKSATKLDLSSDAPSADATIAESDYTIELVSASDTAATIKVINKATGASESKEVNEAQSKKIGGITIAVITADETNLKLSASVVAGSDKVTLEDGSSVLIGEDDTVVDGTTVLLYGNTATDEVGSLTKVSISFDAPESDEDSVNVGESYTDPVFETVKLDFSGVNIGEDSNARELITVRNSGDDLMEVVFSEHRGNEITTIFAKNGTTFFELMHDDDQHNISIREFEAVHAGDFVVIGNEDNGYLLKLESTANSSTSGTNNDRAKFTDLATLDSLDTVWTAEGTGTISAGGVTYTITMSGDASNSSEQRNVRISYPDSSGNGVVVYPTIQTVKGAKFAFYEPLTINVSNLDGDDRGAGTETNVTSFLFPDGDGYETITITAIADVIGTWGVSDGGGAATNLSTNQTDSVLVSIGRLAYNLSTNSTIAGSDNQDEITIYLQQPGGANIAGPAIVLWEEKDDNNEYNALVIPVENGLNSDDGIGVDNVYDTWSNGSGTWESTLKTNTDLSERMNLWGSIATEDTSDSDQKTATISYNDEQVYAQVYVGASSAAITAGVVSGGAAQLGDVLVKDSEVSSVSSKNLVVVGGSCINSVAANLVGGAKCGSGWTDATGVGAGQFLIQSFADKYTTGKIALLVAGYEVSDTVNAAKYLRTQAVKTDAGTKYKGTSSTSASLVTEETA